LPEVDVGSFFWVAPSVLWQSRNDLLAAMHEPISDKRHAWMARLGAAGKTTENQIIDRLDLGRFSFLVIGDPDEGDHSQYRPGF